VQATRTALQENLEGEDPGDVGGQGDYGHRASTMASSRRQRWST
jgi:hypothetical protein